MQRTGWAGQLDALLLLLALELLDADLLGDIASSSGFDGFWGLANGFEGKPGMVGNRGSGSACNPSGSVLLIGFDRAYS